MSTLIEWMKQLSSLQAALIAAGVVAVLAVAFVLWRKPKLPGVAQIAAGRSAAQGVCAWLWGHVLKLARTLDYLFTRREWRYDQPWMLMLGEPAAGKTSLLRSVSLAVCQTPPKRASELQAGGTQWLYFRKGVLIDAEGKLPAAAEGSSEAQTWANTLDQLHALRPERPLDGLVVCISARTLRGASASRDAVATNIFQQLTQLQERLEFMLPLTVVVTQCDSVGGFEAFWRTQNTARRVELFGYAAPAQSQSAAPSEWVDDAFESINERLRALQVEVAAHHEHIADPDGFFLFPGHFQRLRAPLRDVMETVFRTSAWQAGFLFRGLFFTGSAIANGEQREGPRDDVAFVDALLSARVLSEPGLARPTRNSIFSRSRLIRSMQYTSIAAALGLFGSLYVSSQHITAQVNTLITALEELKTATPNAVRHGDCLDAESVYPLLTEISHIDHRTHRWAVPASWLDTRVRERSDAHIENGAINTVLMPTLACQLENRARSLAQVPLQLPAVQVDTAFQTAQDALTAKLASVRELEDNLARYEKLVERGDQLDREDLLQTLSELAQYAFGAKLPEDVMQERGALSQGFGKVSHSDMPELPPRMRENFARQITALTNATRSSLAARTASGAQLLEALNRGEAPVLGNTRRFADWLTWTQKSWLLSTPKANPCEAIRLAMRSDVDLLVSQYAYDKSLWRDTEEFNADHCYKDEMKALAELRQAPYGALFVEHKPFGYELAPGLQADLVGLPALVQLSFMRMSAPRRFVCLPASDGFRQSDVTAATNYVHEYQEFAKRMKLPADDTGVRPLYDRLARLSLASALDDAMARAQLPSTSSPDPLTGLEVVTRADQQLATLSSTLTATLDPLKAVLGDYGSYGNPASAAVVRQCARDFASDVLSRISALSDASRLYAPPAAAVGDLMFDLGSLPVQKEYLSRQVARAQVLAGYATPFMNLLQGSQGVTDANRPLTSTAAYWRNTIDELNRYTQGKEPTGQVANLDNYFIKQLATLTYSGCGKQLAAYDSPEFGNDLFSERRRTLESAVAQRCTNRRSAQAMELYEGVARRFNRELGGRFPFADSTASDARIAIARQFFIDYAAQRSALQDAMGELSGDRWRAAQQFVTQLDAAASFFAGNLAAPEASAPIRLRLVFNAPNRAASGGEQIVSWMLSSGLRAAGLPNRPGTLDWDIGESLALDLTWANRSLWSPVADPQQADLEVDGNTASFMAMGQWAALRMIAQHGTSDEASAGQKLLRFNVPEQRELVPGKADRSSINVFLGVTLVSVDPKTQAETKLRLPVFPRHAPVD